MSIRLRFAPSPTGFLHIGNIRVALLNYIYAKKYKGEALLRIDDTDTERYSKEYEDAIIKDLKWLGLPHDVFCRQSENTALYTQAFEFLKKEGKIYPCFESQEELARERKYQLENKRPPIYNRKALRLSDEVVKSNIDSGMSHYWRFKLPDKPREWVDLIHNNITIPLESVSDPVIMKADGGFVYSFASVVDDINMGITHILRGDDHITNTAVQSEMFVALNGKLPVFAHFPLVSSLDGGEISKRSGSHFSIGNLREAGVEPLSVIASLCELGTSYEYTQGDSLDDVINKFDFSKISLSTPRFSLNSIYILNSKIIHKYNFNDVKIRLQKELHPEISEELLEKFWNIVKGNISKFHEVKKWYDVCFSGNCEIIILDRDFASSVKLLLSQSELTWGLFVEQLKNATGKKGYELFHTMRLLLTGLDQGPSMNEIFEIIDKSKAIKRIENKLNS